MNPLFNTVPTTRLCCTSPLVAMKTCSLTLMLAGPKTPASREKGFFNLTLMLAGPKTPASREKGFFTLRALALLGLLALWPVIQGCSVTAGKSGVVGADHPAKPGASDGVARVYIVRKGDTLSLIARRHAVSTTQLQYYNGLKNPNHLDIGDRLRIPDSTVRVPGSWLNSGQGFIWPLQKLSVTSEFGSRGGRHRGIDLQSPKGSPIRAAADGVVYFSGKQNGYGRVVILQHPHHVRTLYAHNRKNLVKKGQRIKQGQRIAKVGHSGRATGSHVHFEYIVSGRKLNPRHYVSGVGGSGSVSLR